MKTAIRQPRFDATGDEHNEAARRALQDAQHSFVRTEPAQRSGGGPTMLGTPVVVLLRASDACKQFLRRDGG